MPRRKTNRVRVHIYLDPAPLKAATYLAAQRSLSVSDVVRAAVKQYVLTELEHEKKAPVLSETPSFTPLNGIGDALHELD